MDKAKSGDTVKIHITEKMEGDTVAESSQDRGPLEFKIGEGNVITGLEQGVIGMRTGDKKAIKIPPEDAFGQPHDELVIDLNKSEIPEGVKLSAGVHLNIQTSDGQVFKVKVVDVKEDTVTVDANHPLAGETLNFEVELIEIG